MPSSFVVALFLLCTTIANASTLTYNFNLTWLLASPDGFTRPVIGVNNAWPPPTINATLGDTIIVDVHNQLGNQSSSIHFHGLFMNGTNRMDGTSGIVQCAIPPDGRFRYEFKVKQAGTYWYHSHAGSQYPDGLRGVLIVQNPNSPFKDMYNEEIVLTLSDWYHKQMPDIMPSYEDPSNSMASDPKPDAFLINDAQDLEVDMQPGKTYLVRMVNIGAYRTQKFWIEEHEMIIVELDGVYTKPTRTSMISLAPGQRCAFLLKAKDAADTNYAMGAAIDTSLDTSHMMSSSKTAEKSTVSGWLIYDTSSALPYLSTAPDIAPIDDATLQPYDETFLLEEPTVSINLTVDMKRLDDKIVHWTFDKTSYSQPDTPTLFSALTNGDYDEGSLPFVLPHNAVVELVLYNKHMSGHPMHLHGHAFQVLHRSGKSAGRYAGTEELARTPVRRDTVIVGGGGNAVLRFRADNPGVWFFHCHVEWHAHSGLAATFIEAPDMIKTQEPLSLLADMKMGNLQECTPVQMWPTTEQDVVDAGSVLNDEAENSEGENQDEKYAEESDADVVRGSGTFQLLTIGLGLLIATISVMMVVVTWKRSRGRGKNAEVAGCRRHKQSYSVVLLTDKDEQQRQDGFEIGNDSEDEAEVKDDDRLLPR